MNYIVLFNRILFVIGVLMLVETQIFAQQSSNETAMQSFRIETETFQSGTDKALSKNLTLADARYVYDFLEIQDELEEIVIHDQARNNFILLNMKRKVRSDVGEDQILKSLVDLKNVLVEKKVTDLANPEFKINMDEETDTLVLIHKKLTYKVNGEIVSDDQKLKAYFEFANWFSRLKATNPTTFPPFVRLAVNKQLEKQKMIPETVSVAFKGMFGVSKSEFHTKHNTSWIISDYDRKRIKDAKDKIATFERVTISEYHGVQVAQAKN